MLHNQLLTLMLRMRQACMTDIIRSLLLLLDARISQRSIYTYTGLKRGLFCKAHFTVSHSPRL